VGAARSKCMGDRCTGDAGADDSDIAQACRPASADFYWLTQLFIQRASAGRE
jgi:hypothetical protein